MREEGYDVIPVRSSSDLVRYFSRSARQVFFLDNLCGKYNISNSDIEEWDRNRDTLVHIFTNSSTKCIFTCRLQIFLDPKFENLKLTEYNVIDLTGAHRLSLEEKQSIGKIHLGKSKMKQLTDQTIVNCLCFPLLCSLYDKHDKNSKNPTAYFEKPKSFFETELSELKEKPDKTKYGCIALCVMLNNKVDLDFFNSTNEKGRRIARAIFEELGVNVPPMKAIMSCFDSMVGSFFQITSKKDINYFDPFDISFYRFTKTIPGYKSIHDYMFDVYCAHVSKTMINMIILYGDSELIRDRTLLQSIGKYNENAIVIPVEFEQQFFERTLKDLSSCRVNNVFGSNQLKYDSYRSKFIKFLDLIDFDVNIRDKYGITPMYKASEDGYVDVVEMLCKKGVDVNLSGMLGWTPLIAASSMGHIDVVKLLCDKGADVNLIGIFGSTPLTAASERGHIAVVEMLCNKGADANMRDELGLTPLTAALGKGHIDIVEILCNKGADANLCDEFGSTPLTAASGEGYIDVVELLYNKGANVNLSAKDECTPLMVASIGGHIDVVKLLCNKGADVNLSDKYGSTPLTAASGEGHIDVVELLCHKGANLNLNDNLRAENGSTSLTAASGEGHTDDVELLCNIGATVIINGFLSVKNTWTPLTAASGKGHIGVVELLCNKGADVNLSSQVGSTPLTVASGEGHIDVVELLCNKGSNVNQNDKNRWTPLTAASITGHTDVVELLCNKGADVNLRGKDGLTPLMAALIFDHTNVVEMLRRMGAT